MIIKFECVFQDVRLAEVPEASHLVLIDFRTRVRILTVPSVKLQVPQPTLHLLFFSQNISSVQFGREGRAASLGGCRDTNPGSNPGSPQCGYSGFPIKLNTLCWRYFCEKNFWGTSSWNRLKILCPFQKKNQRLKITNKITTYLESLLNFQARTVSSIQLLRQFSWTN